MNSLGAEASQPPQHVPRRRAASYDTPRKKLAFSDRPDSREWLPPGFDSSAPKARQFSAGSTRARHDPTAPEKGLSSTEASVVGLRLSVELVIAHAWWQVRTPVSSGKESASRMAGTVTIAFRLVCCADPGQELVEVANGLFGAACGFCHSSGCRCGGWCLCRVFRLGHVFKAWEDRAQYRECHVGEGCSAVETKHATWAHLYYRINACRGFALSFTC